MFRDAEARVPCGVCNRKRNAEDRERYAPLKGRSEESHTEGCSERAGMSMHYLYVEGLWALEQGACLIVPRLFLKKDFISF